MDGGWFEWDESNEDHVLRHGVEREEFEDAILDPDGVGAGAYNVPGEKRDALIGSTGAGRILYVVYTMRDDRLRPVTARDADGTEKRRYRRGRR